MVVTCEVGHTEKGILSNPKTRVLLDPSDGVSVLDHRIMATAPGLFDVACEFVQDVPVKDTTPAQLLETTPRHQALVGMADLPHGVRAWCVGGGCERDAASTGRRSFLYR